ncbi:MAG: hypothetical protein WBQ86_18295, partial [Candidatus Binatus sp.]
RIEAASIAAAIALLFVSTPRIPATWLAAAGVRLSAATTATILCPSNPQPHANTGQSRTANTKFATQTAAERDDRRSVLLFFISIGMATN